MEKTLEEKRPEGTSYTWNGEEVYTSVTMTFRRTWLLGSDCPGTFAFLQEPWRSSPAPPNAFPRPAMTPCPVTVIQALSKSTVSSYLAPATRIFLQPRSLLLITGQKEWFLPRNLPMLPSHPVGAPQRLEDKNRIALPWPASPSTSPLASSASPFPITPTPGLRDHP